MISAGRKNRKVTINAVSVTNTKGDWVETLVSKGTRYASREPMSHREVFTSDQRFASADYLFKFTSDTVTRAINAEYVLKYDSKEYQVVGALPGPEDMDREVWIYTTRKETTMNNAFSSAFSSAFEVA